MSKHEDLTQQYSTWGDKLLQHTDVLASIQYARVFKPITVQLAPVEACFSGDTKISLLDGTEQTLKELSRKKNPFWVYAFDIVGNRVVPALAKRSRMTRRNTPLMEVVLDNGEVVRCTEDHRWMIRDGSYLRADALKPGQSLMPLYRRLSTVADDSMTIGYEMILDAGNGGWGFTQPINHKVVSVRRAGLGNTYCLEVEHPYHNFALSAGVFVSNCDSDCPFCSVAARPLKSYMPFPQVQDVLGQFKHLGAKSVEITGGGNPMLYRDRRTDRDINDIVCAAHDLGLEVGIITNSHDFKRLDPGVFPFIKWIRVSLIQLDEGVKPEDYSFNGFPEDRLGFSYIIYETGGVQDALSRTHRVYQGTTLVTIQHMARLVELHPQVKFVRIAGNCLVKGNNAAVRDEWKDIIDAVDTQGKFFVKDIGNDDGPFDAGCYVGLVRPYVAPAPDGSGYCVYTCTSHVLNTRTYDPAYALCKAELGCIVSAWDEMNSRFADTGVPYEVKGNGGKGWCKTCKFCYYQHNNRLLHTVASEMPDRNFA